MILLSHILIAVFSVIYTIYLFFYPSKAKLNIVYALVAFTFITGGYLVFAKPAHLTQTCISGLVYLAVIMSGVVLVRRKLHTTDL